jgi:hypothetical protein
MAKIPNKTIAEVSVVPVHLLQDMMVNDLVDVSGQWNLPMLDSWMPQHVSDILLANSCTLVKKLLYIGTAEVI